MTALDIFEVRSRRRGLSLVHKCMVGNALSSIRSSLAWHLIQFEPGSWRYPEIKRAGESITRLALHLGMELTDGDKNSSAQTGCISFTLNACCARWAGAYHFGCRTLASDASRRCSWPRSPSRKTRAPSHPATMWCRWLRTKNSVAKPDDRDGCQKGRGQRAPPPSQKVTGGI